MKKYVVSAQNKDWQEGYREGRRIHIGRKAPKGYKELAGGIHIGKGIWILPITPEELTGQINPMLDTEK